MDVNLKSYFLMAKYAIPEMRKRGGGAIVNNASVQGLQSMKGVPPYAASKGGVLSLTRQLAVEYAAKDPGAGDLPGHDRHRDGARLGAREPEGSRRR